MGKQIDFIVPHYNEPWEIGEKFFRMLALQRNINFDDIRVLIVQDGEEGNLEWNTLLTNLPYDVKVLTIPHGGVSAAKNAGLGAATAEWVMFCDFDDMFADVCSLNMILGLMPTDKADILWMNTYREQYMRGKDPFVNCIEDNFTFAYGKLFRRSFLKECGICFPDIPFEADYAFCSLALSECESTRVLRITTKFTMYMKTIRKLSYTLQRKNISRMVESIFFADTYLVNEYDRRGNIDEKRTAVAKTILDTYYILNCTPKINHAQEIERLFIEFYNENKQLFEEVNPHEMEIVVDASEKHLCNVLLTLYNNFLVEAGAPECGINHVRKWLRRIGAHKEAYMSENNNVKSQVIYENKAKVVSIPVNVEGNHENGQGKEPEISDNDTEDDIRQEADTDERVIVYSGTRNTYECILASLKSVVAHSRVDKVYLLIEDDEFPFEVPDFVTVLNVSNQTFFDKNGPNFNCSWSYMCLMRAAYPKLFPQHKKVLSLDIDTIILDDIEGLWNTDLSDYYIAGVHEKDKAQSDYINFGVVLMNLELLRKEEVDEQMIHLLNTAKQNCPEQDAFNATCEGKILCLPSEYNYTPFTHLIAEPEHERIIHYAGIQYWKGFSPSQKYLRMPWEEIYAIRQEMAAPEQAGADEQTDDEDDDFDKKKTVHHGGEHPLLTVIMPAHNAASYMTKGLESIRTQSFQDYELIVICDACMDNTAEIARKYTDRVFEVDNHLPGPTRNTGIDNAKGEWIIFIDDDDWFLHEFVFEMLAEQLGKGKNDVLHFAWLWKGKGYYENKPDDLRSQVCGHVWRREFIGETRFNNDMFAEDAKFFHDMMDKDPVSVCWNMPLYYYNFGRRGSICWWHQRGRR